MEQSFAIPLPPSVRPRETLVYLGRDPHSLTERVHGATWEAGVWLAGRPVRLTVELAPAVARCTVASAEALSPEAVAAARGIAARRLGLGLDPAEFEAGVATGDPLAPLVERRRGLRLPLTAEPFECLLWAIVGQQINLPFARRLLGRVVERTGTPLPEDPAREALWAPPRPAAVAALSVDELQSVQFSRRKAEYLVGTAALVAAGDLDLDRLAAGTVEEAEAALLAVRGLGPWSVSYLMMRGLGFTDCVPWGDSGLLRSLQHVFALPARPTLAETRALMERFRPHRSLATFHLWQHLEDLP